MLKRICLTLLLGLLFMLQAAPWETLPDITGTGATVQLTTQHRLARYIQLTVNSHNLNPVKWGGAATSISQGAEINPTQGQFFSPKGDPYDLSDIYLYIASGDKVSVTWLNF